jgi:hypothetical protein
MMSDKKRWLQKSTIPSCRNDARDEAAVLK